HEKDNDAQVESRRHFLKMAAGTAAVAAVAGTGVFARVAHAKDLPPLSPSDPTPRRCITPRAPARARTPNTRRATIAPTARFTKARRARHAGHASCFRANRSTPRVGACRINANRWA